MQPGLSLVHSLLLAYANESEINLAQTCEETKRHYYPALSYHLFTGRKKNLGRSLPMNQMSPSVDNYVSQFGTWGPQAASKEEKK